MCGKCGFANETFCISVTKIVLFPFHELVNNCDPHMYAYSMEVLSFKLCNSSINHQDLRLPCRLYPDLKKEIFI